MNLIKVIALFILLGLINQPTIAEAQNKDSIQLLIENDYNYAEKIPQLLQESRSFLKTSSSQVRKYALQALHYSQGQRDTLNMALSYNYIGASYVMEYSYDTAFNILFKGLVLAEKSDIPRARAKLYNNIATIYELESNSEQAFKYYKLAVETLRKAGIDGVYMPKLSLASYYCKQGDGDLANLLQTEVLQDATLRQDTSIQILARLNILESYCRLKKSSFDQMKQMLDSIYQLSQLSKDRKYDIKIKKIYINMLLEDKAYQVVIDSTQQLLTKKLIYKTRYGLYYIISQAYEGLNKYPEALSYQRKLDSLIKNKYSLVLQKSSSNQDAIYQLSNQKLILKQIQQDREIEKGLYLRNRIYIQFGPYLVIILLIIILVLTILLLNEVEKNKQQTTKNQRANDDTYQYLQDDLKSLNHLGLPVFQMNEKYMYIKANDSFLQYAHKDDLQSFIGCTDFDLHWSHHAEMLAKEYDQIRENLDIRIIDARLMDLPDHLSICLIPLIQKGMFSGIQGMLTPKKIRLEEEMKESQMKNVPVKDAISRKPEPKKTVLLVDDEPDNLLLLKLYLSHTEIEVKTANGGLQAIDEAGKSKYDFILLDINMPDLGGVEAAKEIRTHSLCTDSQIIALTASVNDDGDLMKTNYFDSVIHKPISKSMLYSKLSISLKSQ